MQRLKGFAYGFMEVVFNGQRILYHGGDISPFHGLLVLIPGQNLGFFISYNTDTSAGLWSLDLLSFVEHYYPQDKGRASAPGGFRCPGWPLRGFLSTDARFLHDDGKSKCPEDLERDQAFP